MKLALIGIVLVVAGFAGGWFTHRETQKRCYVLPAYTAQTSNSLLPGSGGVNPPELVCK